MLRTVVSHLLSEVISPLRHDQLPDAPGDSYLALRRLPESDFHRRARRQMTTRIDSLILYSKTHRVAALKMYSVRRFAVKLTLDLRILPDQFLIIQPKRIHIDN